MFYNDKWGKKLATVYKITICLNSWTTKHHLYHLCICILYLSLYLYTCLLLQEAEKIPKKWENQLMEKKKILRYIIYSFIFKNCFILFKLQWNQSLWNTRHDAGIHLDWDASLPQGTIHTHIHTLVHLGTI